MAGDRLHGFSMMEDSRDSIILGNTLEVFTEDGRAGFLVGSMDDADVRELMVFTSPGMIATLRNLIDLMRETAGLPTIEQLSGPNPACPICGGLNYWTDQDGNQIDCGACR